LISGLSQFARCWLPAVSLGFVLFAFASLEAQEQRATPPPAEMHTIASASRIVPPPPTYRFPDDQTYVYSVEWRMFTAGMARVTMSNAGAQRRVSSSADSQGFVNAIYSVHDRFEALFDPRTFCSQRIAKHAEEGSRRRDTQVYFNYAQHKSILDEKNLKDHATRHVENDIPACVTDTVTGFYYLASKPLRMGDVYTFPVSEGGVTTEVRATVEAREHVKVPAGTYDAVRVVAEPTTGPQKQKAKVSVWFVDDANRTPVQMRAKLGWGTLTFKLQRIETR
jgi:hypothetical protein